MTGLDATVLAFAGLGATVVSLAGLDATVLALGGVDAATLALAVGALAAAVNSVGVFGSALGVSDYYPPGEAGWNYYAFWVLANVVTAAVMALGYLQWGALPIPPWVRALAGLTFAVGLFVAVAAGRDLGSEETRGLEGDLRTGGWYRYSRNPQYVGYVLTTLSFPVLSAAPLTVPLCAVYLAWWAAFPRAEEPWLREQYGEAYERYAERVPRFVGVHTVRELVGRTAGRPRRERT